MRLKKLVVHGFKSFKDRTTIHFDQGITGIVGPNGCGKSNIVDALFWVMGEQSAQHLRGQNMKDVIFKGTKKFASGSWAEVMLLLENDERKHIHIANKVCNPSEIQISRKLYRNGESEYRINGLPCRLRDIQEVFMDTGAGAKSYSIIAQGQIDKLVQAKPEERRVMIEEVAGITKFKKRKHESIKKIEQTKYNLARLEDLQQEIEKNLKNLDQQAQKAQLATQLKATITENELVVESHKIFNILKDLREGMASLSQMKIDVETWRTTKDQLEVSLEDERIKRDELTAMLDEFNRIFNQLSKELAASEARAEYMQESRKEKSSQFRKRTEEVQQIKRDIDEIMVRLEDLIREKDLLSNKLSSEHDFSFQEERVDLLRMELKQKEEQIQDIKSLVEQKRLEKRDLDQSLFKNTSKQEEYAASIQDITEEIEAIEKQYSGISTEIFEERERVNQSESLVAELALKEEALRATISDLKALVANLERDHKEFLKQSLSVESKLSSLVEINEALEGVKEGTVEFLKNHGKAQFDILGNLINCDEKYTKAVQSVLSEYLETLVCNNDEIGNLFSWVESNPNKSLDILIGKKTIVKTSEETLERLRLQLASMCHWEEGEENIIPLVNMISMPQGYSEHLMSVFDGYYLVNGLSPKAVNVIDTGVHVKALVSFDGAVVIRNLGCGKLMAVGQTDESSQGFIARNNKISDLTSELKEVRDQFETVDQKLKNTLLELADRTADFEKLRDHLSEAKASYASRKSALESRISGLETGSKRLEIQKNRKNEISKQRLFLLEEEEKFSRHISDLNEVIDVNLCELSTLGEDLQNLKSEYEVEKNDLLQKKVEAASLEDRFKTAISRVNDFEKQIEKNEEKLELNEKTISELDTEVQLLDEQYHLLIEDNKIKAQQLRDREDLMGRHKDELAELMLNMQSRENEAKELARNIVNVEKRMTALEVRHEQSLNEEQQVVRNIFEKYRIDLRRVIGEFIGYSEDEYLSLGDISSMYTMETHDGLQAVRKEDFVFELLESRQFKKAEENLKKARNEYILLGDVNWQAIEDFRRQKMRFDFLQEQEQELRQSLEDLEKAILHIDHKSKERFKLAFEEVNERFQKVFPILFGGGSAHLKVAGDLDNPECGVEIIAQPPGKVMSNNNLLSGGEKALTAVSLIFSIFLVKPSPFCLLDEVDAPLDDANVSRFNELLREMSSESQFILITHNKKTMEMNDLLYGITMEELGVSKAVSVQLQ